MSKNEILNYVRNMRENVDISRLENMLDELIKTVEVAKPVTPVPPSTNATKLPSEMKKNKK